MADLYVKPNHQVDHNGTLYGSNPEGGDHKAGYQITDLSDEQAKALLNAGVCQTQDPQKGVSKLDTHSPTDEEIAAVAAEAGQVSDNAEEAKRGGILNFGR